MIVVTGGEGFIGKNLVRELQRQGNIGIVVLDTKNESLSSIYQWLMTHAKEIDVIFHLGAITDTTVTDRNLFDEYNVVPSMFIWNICVNNQIPLIYASSAATYGDGLEGFDDEMDIITLNPLNPYGWSKHQFDVWADMQEKQPPYWYGLKFFNVYGYGEEEKGKMASVVLQIYKQILALRLFREIYSNSSPDVSVKLFKSHKPDYKDGEQLRDFIYVDDIVDTCLFFWKEKPMSGIYNVGTGKARTFNDLVNAIFKGLGKSENISYIDIPIKLRDKYQYFTEAKIVKLRGAGYTKPFYELENGIAEYIKKLEDENC
jgi:ADP-L-glycero-D-manno-heptose 6-epimerase